MTSRKIRRQKPVRGGRKRLSASFIREIEREVERTAARFHVSRSFVIAVAVADSLGVEDQESFISQHLWTVPKIKLASSR